MFDEMLEIADQMLVRWERFGPDSVIEVTEDMTRLTLDTIALCAFDYRFNSFYQREMHPFVGAMVDALSEPARATARIGLANKLMLRTRRAYEADLRLMREVADALIAERKRDPQRREQEGPPRPHAAAPRSGHRRRALATRTSATSSSPS